LKNDKPAFKVILVVFVLGFLCIEGQSQIAVNSPYSRYGVGDLATRQDAYHYSMGGISYAISNPRFINPFNPASNHAFDSLSFVFTGGIATQLARLSTDETSSDSEYITLGYLLFGFPITHWLKASIGITPYSNVGYNIVDEQVIENVGATNFYYLGSGGLNEFFLNLSLQVHKNLALGVKTSYMFGKAEKGRLVSFPDSAYILNTRLDNYIEVGDLFFEFGAQYNKDIGRNLTLGLGAVYMPQQQIKSTETYLARTFFGDATDVGLFKDTIDSRIKNEGNITFPQKIGFGLMLRKGNNWMVGADYEWQNWSEFKAFGVSDSLQNSMRFSLGGEYKPSQTGIGSYFENVTYRLGVRYNQTYLNLRNTKINEFGISFGFGLPLPRSYSSINLAVEVGKRGTTAFNLIQENYIRFTLGVSIKETWFIKRKYN
jgi:hypothetical protein